MKLVILLFGIYLAVMVSALVGTIVIGVMIFLITLEVDNDEMNDRIKKLEEGVK